MTISLLITKSDNFTVDKMGYESGLPLGTYESYHNKNSEKFLLDIGYKPELAKTASERNSRLKIWKVPSAVNEYVLEVELPGTNIHPWYAHFQLDAIGHGRTLLRWAGKSNTSETQNSVLDTFQWNEKKRDLYQICEKTVGIIYYIHYTFSDCGDHLIVTRHGPNVYDEVKYRRISSTP
ncbi:uncharacterized protein LOC129592589 [Paramacrobiotus metropolitanus]|uniref:uncharacterized protein LOC129592589 n=1 Tax=Paramacrobiotus metropolitanus TaxID=2943436 RepID=UPI002445A497|nr:uncharacterized protein LOC129592589 [Paramacrobiotus metropolitanus]